MTLEAAAGGKGSSVKAGNGSFIGSEVELPFELEVPFTLD